MMTPMKLSARPFRKPKAASIKLIHARGISKSGEKEISPIRMNK